MFKSPRAIKRLANGLVLPVVEAALKIMLKNGTKRENIKCFDANEH